MRKTILFLTALIAVSLVIAGCSSNAQSSPEVSTIQNCGSPNVDCVFDNGDSWANVLTLNGRLVGATNITSSGLGIGDALKVSLDSLTIQPSGAVRIAPSGLLVLSSSQIYMSQLPPNTTHPTRYYLCIDGVNRVYKSTQPCV